MQLSLIMFTCELKKHSRNYRWLSFIAVTADPGRISLDHADADNNLYLREKLERRIPSCMKILCFDTDMLGIRKRS